MSRDGCERASECLPGQTVEKLFLFISPLLLNIHKMAVVNGCMPVVTEEDIKQHQRGGKRQGTGLLVYFPMTLVTNESSSSSSLIPTKWPTTSPPRMPITVGTAETCNRTSPITSEI